MPSELFRKKYSFHSLFSRVFLSSASVPKLHSHTEYKELFSLFILQPITINITVTFMFRIIIITIIIIIITNPSARA